jgi:hypothetical protein
MKVFVILAAYEMNSQYIFNTSSDAIFDFCGIYNNNNFNNYEHAIGFKYKSINKKET